MILVKWSEIKVSIFPAGLEPDFRTHYNYTNFLCSLSRDLALSHNYKFVKKIEEIPKELKKKIRLIKTFKKSIDDEFNGIKECNELAIINNSWIATKSYYLLFHMWDIIYYLTHLNNLNGTHLEVNKFIRDAISKKNIVFSKDDFNKVYPYDQIDSMKCIRGENLREDYDKKQIKYFILKRIANTKINDLKFRNKIKTFAKAKHRKTRDNFKSSEKNILIDFFYMCRIKNHYRDLDFLGKSDNTGLHFKYYNNYYNLTSSFYNALKELMNNLSEKRFGKKLIKN
jgi:hypothetical protein